MDFDDFIQSQSDTNPPEKLSAALKSLWHEAKGDWEAAHNIAQDMPSKTGSWIHAYLHRVEGDLGNASYWYSKASRKMPDVDLKKEWESIVKELLSQPRQQNG